MIEYPGIRITRDPSLAERTTLRLGGRARAEAAVTAEGGLYVLDSFLGQEGAAPLALGAGSNILARDTDLPLVLVRPLNAATPGYVDRDGRRVLVRVQAGMRLPGLLAWAARMGLSGLEGLTGIPGSVGGSLAMNAGSFGMELGGLLSRVRLWTPGQGLAWRQAGDLTLGYRHFDPGLPGFFMVWEAEFWLTAADPREVRRAMAEVYARKKAVQPVTARTCGCVFKNPEGQSAGRLLDQSGFRGRREGRMELSAMHANFLVNLGGGTAAQALTLIESARAAVRAAFGVRLETEVRIL